MLKVIFVDNLLFRCHLLIMKIALSLDSACDLTKELIAEYDFHIIPFRVSIGEEEYLDGEIKTLDIFAKAEAKKILPKTSAINAADFEKHFSELLQTYDAVIHFSIGSDLSSAYQNALTAVKNLRSDKIFVVDTKNLSTAIALVAIYTKNLMTQTNDPRELFAKANEIVPYIQGSFVIDRLDYLYKGGRCSALAYFGANLLKLKPQINVVQGKLQTGAKFMGKSVVCVRKYCENVLKNNPNPDKSLVFITHSMATPEMVNAAKQAVINAGFTRILETVAGGTVSCHCGKNTLGILFINQK